MTESLFHARDRGDIFEDAMRQLESGGPTSSELADNARREFDVLMGERDRQRNALLEVRHLVDEQAEDERLWFFAQTAPEAYLQQELRKLHGLVERATDA